ncbi:MAG: DUF1294 domain-containing protein [Nitrososphaerota archaeon]
MAAYKESTIAWRNFAIRVLEYAPLITLLTLSLYFAAYLVVKTISYFNLALSLSGPMAILAPIDNILNASLRGDTAVYVLGALFLAAAFMASPRLGLFIALAAICGGLVLMFLLVAVLAIAGGSSAPSLGDFIRISLSLTLGLLAIPCIPLLKWMASNMATITTIALAMNGLSALAMWLDKRQAQAFESSLAFKVRRLPEKAIRRYAAVWGGFGVLAASLIFRHKTLHRLLILQVSAYTAIAYTMLILAAGI